MFSAKKHDVIKYKAYWSEIILKSCKEQSAKVDIWDLQLPKVPLIMYFVAIPHIYQLSHDISSDNLLKEEKNIKFVNIEKGNFEKKKVSF